MPRYGVALKMPWRVGTGVTRPLCQTAKPVAAGNNLYSGTVSRGTCVLVGSAFALSATFDAGAALIL
jgi:hypothetical protein